MPRQLSYNLVMIKYCSLKCDVLVTYYCKFYTFERNSVNNTIQRYAVHLLFITGTSVRISLDFVSVKTLWDFAVRSWIYVCLAILVVIAVNGRVVFFRVIYMIFFLGYVISFQVGRTGAVISHS